MVDRGVAHGRDAGGMGRFGPNCLGRKSPKVRLSHQQGLGAIAHPIVRARRPEVLGRFPEVRGINVRFIPTNAMISVRSVLAQELQRSLLHKFDKGSGERPLSNNSRGLWA